MKYEVYHYLVCTQNFHFSLSCIGEGNGNPLQYSCLEDPNEGGASWFAIYGVAKSQTQLKRLRSSSSSSSKFSSFFITSYIDLTFKSFCFFKFYVLQRYMAFTLHPFNFYVSHPLYFLEADTR